MIALLQLSSEYNPFKAEKKEPYTIYLIRQEGGISAPHPMPNEDPDSPNSVYVASMRFKIASSLTTFEDMEPVRMLALAGTVGGLPYHVATSSLFAFNLHGFANALCIVFPAYAAGAWPVFVVIFVMVSA